MKKIDKDGLRLCSLQGNIFALSLKNAPTSSDIFIRRFMNSAIVKIFDSSAILDDSLTKEEIFQIIENEFGKSNYGTVKYDYEVLFWIGYVYRYMAYTYELSSKQVYKIVKPSELNERYYVYHTFDCGLAIDRILEEKNISFDPDKQNERLLKLLRRRAYESEVTLLSMNEQMLRTFSMSLGENKSLFKEDGHTLIAVLYKNQIVGNVRFFKYDEVYDELEVLILNEQYRNKGLGSVVIKKALEYAIDELKMINFLVKLHQTDERSIHVYQKQGFSFLKEDGKYVYFAKKSTLK